MEEKNIESNENKIKKLIEDIKKYKKIVFFGGAGVSTESGIPDFRSKDGIYNKKYKYNPEYMLSHTFFVKNTEEFFDFYKSSFDLRKYKPNITHKVLKKLEDSGKLIGIITQNIDGLHEKAGSKKVYNLHGSIYENECMECKKRYNEKEIFEKEGIPRCSCGGIIKPKVVLYEEALDENVINQAVNILKEADLVIVGGTSLMVYPANTFLSYAKNAKIYIINKSELNINPLLFGLNFKKEIIHIESSLGKVFEKIQRNV